MCYSELAAAGGKWFLVVHNFNKKKKTPTVSTRATDQSYMYSNYFPPQSNLIENKLGELNSKNKCEWLSTTNSMKKKTLFNLVLAIKFPL